ncbi:MAG: hypothetical protein M3309_08000 [Actinomycetota bacterium]|nr:hypothetical protein [Actinomycetota bacterium]
MTTDPQDGNVIRYKKQRWTDFGYSSACLFLAFLLVAAPWYFEVGAVLGSLVGFIFSLLCYVGGTVFGLYALVFVNAGFQKHPELRRLLPGFLGSEDAWQSAFGSATLCAIAACIHLIAVTAFDAEGAIALMAKLVTYFFLVMGVTLLAQSLDGFVRLLLSSLSEGEANWDSVVGRVRRIGTVIVATIAFVAALATIVDVFFLDS